MKSCFRHHFVFEVSVIISIFFFLNLRDFVKIFGYYFCEFFKSEEVKEFLIVSGVLKISGSILRRILVIRICCGNPTGKNKQCIIRIQLLCIQNISSVSIIFDNAAIPLLRTKLGSLSLKMQITQ